VIETPEVLLHVKTIEGRRIRKVLVRRKEPESGEPAPAEQLPDNPT
jgi:CBS domain containing-hemolysin-like protein